MIHSFKIFLIVATAVALSFGTTLAQDTSAGPDQNHSSDKEAPFSEIEFAARDGLKVTADLYWKYDDKTKPFIVLCHQAGWSRGEYREIAPILNEMGFNCLAVDQRSGNAVKGVSNKTNSRAAKAEKPTSFVDAEQDMVAAIQYVREHYAKGRLILWGSSYSSALALRIAGEHPDKVDGVMAFAPGEYFVRFGKAKDWISTSAKKIACPSFITSAKKEKPNWEGIHEAISTESKSSFVPETKGNHGSRALWSQFEDSEDYWIAVRSFLQQYQEAQ